MTKVVLAGMTTHLGLTVTSLTTLTRITRTDGVNFYFTDHDAAIPFDDGDGLQTYTASASYSRTAISNNAAMSVDNMDVEGVFDDDEIKEDELRAGLFDYAEIKFSIVNWKDTTDGNIKMRRGKFGEVVLTPQGIFRAEVRGLTQELSQNIVENTQAECRADLLRRVISQAHADGKRAGLREGAWKENRTCEGILSRIHPPVCVRFKCANEIAARREKP